MATVSIAPNVYWIGVNDRTTDLFEGLWPITREGVSYNAYLINDEKKAIIDLAKAFKSDDFFTQIADIVPLDAVDYVVINHMEPDHTGVLRTLKRISPDVTFVGTKKTGEMLKNYYQIDGPFMEVGDGDRLSLGRGELSFYATPFVHWPETMMTYYGQEGILFSCDGFGGYGALRGAIFDDQCSDPAFYEREALRYYATIVAKYHLPVLKAIDKLGSLDIRIVAPSHGLIWRQNPSRIIELYDTWSRYGKGENEERVTIVYGSMYGNTEAVMQAVGQGVSSQGVPVDIFDAARTHPAYILPSLWANAGVIVGAPTYEGGLFPPVAHVIEMAIRKAVRKRKAAVFGSYGWSGGAIKQLKKTTEEAGWEILDEFEFPGGPSRDDLKRAEKLGASFASKLKE